MPVYPSFYNDELLYSYIARYHIWSGNVSPKATLNEVFGTANAFAVVDMPCRINLLLKNVTFGVDEESLILAATLFPYYTSFQSPDTTKQILNWMIGSEGRAIHVKLGIMAGGVATPTFLRFCPDCYDADMNTLGEAYWHRIHQIPGIILCPVHGRILLNSLIYYSGIRSNEFFPCNENTCCQFKNEIFLNDTEYIIAKNIADDTKWLIENYHTVRSRYETEGDFRRLYLHWLHEKELVCESNRIHIQDLIKSFRAFYGNNLLEIFESSVSYEDPSNWLISIARKHRKAFHPLRHILMMRFLCGGIQNFMESSIAQNPRKCVSNQNINEPAAVIRKKYRAQWVKACSKNPNKFKTEIRRSIPGVYTWLYRHDKAWLNSHSPSLKREKSKNRIDWDSRDTFILERVKECVPDLFSSDERPIRVTISTIGKKIGELGLIEKHLDKMPKTKDYINGVLESQHEHRIRKIKWAIRQLECEDRVIKAWVVLKMAGIRDKMWPQYSEYIYE